MPGTPPLLTHDSDSDSDSSLIGPSVSRSLTRFSDNRSELQSMVAEDGSGRPLPTVTMSRTAAVWNQRQRQRQLNTREMLRQRAAPLGRESIRTLTSSTRTGSTSAGYAPSQEEREGFDRMLAIFTQPGLGNSSFVRSLAMIMDLSAARASTSISGGVAASTNQTDAFSSNSIFEGPTPRLERLFDVFYLGRDNTNNPAYIPKVVSVTDASPFRAEGRGVRAQYTYKESRDLSTVSIIIGRLVRERWDIDLHYDAIGIVIVRPQV